MGEFKRMRILVVAVGGGVAGFGVVDAGGWVDTGKSLYTGTSLPWLSHITGGLLFGVGMALASGCSSKALIRIGGGNLKSVVVFLVLGISAYMSMKGLFAVWRVASVDTVTLKLPVSQTLPALLAFWGGLDAAAVARWLAALVALALLAYAMKDPHARSREVLLGGVVVGLVIVGGW